MTSTPTATATRTDVLDAVLERAVVLATGNEHAKPREQQRELAHQLWAATDTPAGRAAAQAPTGTGKSLAYLTVVMLRAAELGERAAISTESLSLQAQIVDKDAPVVAEAIQDITGRTVSYALMKGWSNYLCLKAVAGQAEMLLEHSAGNPGSGTLWDASLTELEGKPDVPDVLTWAMRAGADAAVAGDRHTFPDALTEEAWSTVSVAPAECVGVSSCPFATQCKPALAKERAAAAHIIVTNHALLAVQAAHQVAAIVGSKALGPLDTIVVDEAHALPAQVRNQGAGEVSARKTGAMVKAMERLISDSSGRTTVADHVRRGNDIATAIDTALRTSFPGRPRDTIRLPETANPTEAFGAAYESWLTHAVDLVKTYTSATKDPTTEIKVRRFASRVDAAKRALDSAAEHTPGVARWVEVTEDGSHLLRYSPVDVSIPLERGLWTAPEPTDGDEPIETDSDIATGTSDRAVLAVSATLPNGFPAEAGIRGAQVTRYSTPLADALEASAFYVPGANDPDDVRALATHDSAGTSRPRFHTGSHATWARRHVVELVKANGGRALVLSATADAGRAYAQALRDIPDRTFTVTDQWSGRPLRQVVAQWREDETGVLVGTRSLMTGVDAPGDTCSLVILDRIPRSPMNAVDDARVEDIMARTDCDKWAADRSVYVSDAALLLEQAAGRLVRSHSDRGLVAVLDPRLRSRRGSVFTYNEAVRNIYVGALRQFGRALITLDEATEHLRGLRDEVTE